MVTRPPFVPGKIPRYQLDRRLGEPQSQSCNVAVRIKCELGCFKILKLTFLDAYILA